MFVSWPVPRDNGSNAAPLTRQWNMNVCLIHIFSPESDFFFSFLLGFFLCTCLGFQAAYKVMHSNHGKTGIISIVFLQAKEKKKKTGFFLGSKTEFYQRLKVEDNTICLGCVFWAVRFVLTFGLT